MWPLFLYMPKDECLRSLRQLELEAYSTLVSALRAQGPLTQDKRKLLKDACKLLNISSDRHTCEVRRAVNHEKLNTIAYHMNGHSVTMEDWCQEGRRLVPLLQRISTQGLHPILAENLANAPMAYEELPLPNSEESQILLEQSESADCEDETASVEKTFMPKSKLFGQLQDLTSMESEKTDEIYPQSKKFRKNQTFMIVSNTESIPTNSILQKTLSVPISKVTKLNMDKFKIVPTSFSSSLQISNATMKPNTIPNKMGKKIIPLSQFQMLNQKLSSKGGIKVLPISSKIFGKNITMTRITNQQGLKTPVLQPFIQNSGNNPKIKVENIEMVNDITDRNKDHDTHDGRNVENKQEVATCEGHEATEEAEKVTSDTNEQDKKENCDKENEKNEKIEDKTLPDDLASLMEIDASELIESELKEHIIPKKES